MKTTFKTVLAAARNAETFSSPRVVIRIGTQYVVCMPSEARKHGKPISADNAANRRALS